MNQIMLIFFIVLICAVAVYYLVSLKYRWIVLLVASIAFYAIISTYLTPFICLTAVSLAVREVYSKTERFSKRRKNDKEKE